MNAITVVAHRAVILSITHVHQFYTVVEKNYTILLLQ